MKFLFIFPSTRMCWTKICSDKLGPGKNVNGNAGTDIKTLVTEYDVIGVDICGMYPEENSLPEYLRAERVNIRSDEELYRFCK